MTYAITTTNEVFWQKELCLFTVWESGHFVCGEENSSDGTVSWWSSMLNLGHHISQTEFSIANHYLDLIEMLVSTYYNIRQKHVATIHTSAIKYFLWVKEANQWNKITFICNSTHKSSPNKFFFLKRPILSNMALRSYHNLLMQA